MTDQVIVILLTFIWAARGGPSEWAVGGLVVVVVVAVVLVSVVVGHLRLGGRWLWSVGGLVGRASSHLHLGCRRQEAEPGKGCRRLGRGGGGGRGRGVGV